MERAEPIVEDFLETYQGYRHRTVAQNLARISLGVTIGATILSGAVVANYAAPEILEMSRQAIEDGNPLTITPDSNWQLIRGAFEGFARDVNSLLEAAGDVFKVQVDHFQQGTLLEHNKEIIQDLPGAKQAMAAFEYALNTPAKEGGTLAERVGPDVIGFAATCVIGGSVLYTGAKAIRKAMNFAASSFKKVRGVLGAAVDRLRGVEAAEAPRLHDPFSDPIPAILGGEPDQERDFHEKFAELMQDAGLEEYQALGMADRFVAAFVTIGHELREKERALDELSARTEAALTAAKVRIETLQSKVNALSDPAHQRDLVRAALAELSAEQLGAPERELAPEQAPTVA